MALFVGSRACAECGGPGDHMSRACFTSSVHASVAIESFQVLHQAPT